MEYLPFDSQWKAQFPTFYRIYNLFESALPGTGHLAWAVTLAIKSCELAGESRKLNLNIIADQADGKSATLRQFQSLPRVHSVRDLTYSSFLRDFAGKYCKIVGSGFVPRGVRVGEGGEADVSEALDLLDDHTIIIPDAEALADRPDSSFHRIIDLFNPIVEEGFTGKTGDTYNGIYEIGSPEHPISTNLVLAAPPDIQRAYIRRRTFASRLLPLHYRTLLVEKTDVARRIGHQMLDKEPSLQEEVGRILGTTTSESTSPERRKVVTLPRDVQDFTYVLALKIAQLKALTSERLGTDTIKRDAKIALLLTEANALANLRTEATIADVTLALNLVESMSIVKQTRYVDGKQVTDTFHLGSRAHFLMLMCRATDVDAIEFLGRFVDVDGNRLYTEDVLERVMKELALENGGTR
jgi:hypothetical protein